MNGESTLKRSTDASPVGSPLGLNAACDCVCPGPLETTEAVSAESLSQRGQEVLLVNKDGDRFTMKRNRAQPTWFRSARQWTRQKLDLFFRRGNPLQSHLHGSHKHSLAEEAWVLRQWYLQGVPTPNIQSSQPDTLALDYIEGPTLHDLLLKADADSTEAPQAFHAFCHTFQTIRQAAFAKSELRLLHFDPVPRNFIFSIDDNLVYAIDPGGAPTTGLSLVEQDARLSLFCLYAILSVLERNGPADHPAFYTRIFLDSFTPRERQALKRYHPKISRIARNYQRYSRQLLSLRSGNRQSVVQFSSSSTELIDRQLEQPTDGK